MRLVSLDIVFRSRYGDGFCVDLVSSLMVPVGNLSDDPWRNVGGAVGQDDKKAA